MRSRLRNLNKALASLLVLIITMTLFPFSSLVATGATQSNSTLSTTSMISFFRDSRTKLDADAVSRDEVLMYGVFISNFFTPGKTTIKDLTDTTSEDNISKRVSQKFFGSTDKEANVSDINKKVSDAILNGLKGDSYKLYKDTPGGKQLTGIDLFNLFGSASKIIYTGQGTENGKIDFNDPAMQASMKVLYGTIPDLIMDEKVGLRGLGGLYIDGFGNIWGVPTATGNSVEDDYVLFLPACLNPITFAKGNTGLKLPVANAFVMGATPVITEKIFDNVNPFTPYYNIKNHFLSNSSTSDKDLNNMLSIFGVASAIQKVGNSDSLFTSTKDNSGEVKNFISSDLTSFNSSKAGLVIAIDNSKYPSLSDKMLAITSLDENAKYSLVSFFGSSQIIPLEDVADDMYYFNFNAQGSASNGTAWNGTSSLASVVRQKLFTNDGRKNFYANSSASSPFNTFYSSYTVSNNKIGFLKQQFSGISDSNANTLQSFLDNQLIGGTSNPNEIMAAFEKATGNPNLVYGFLPPTENLDVITLLKRGFRDAIWEGGKVVNPTAYGLSASDASVAAMSSVAKGSIDSWKSNVLSKYSYNEQFIATDSGGKLGYVIDDNAKHALANLTYNFNVYKVFSMNYEVAKQLTGTNPNESIKTKRGDLKISTAIANDTNNWPGIYWGYMVQMLNITQTTDGRYNNPTPYYNQTLPNMTIAVSGSALNINDTLDDSGVENSEKKSFEDMQKDIVKKIYGLLQEGPNTYRDALTKATQDSWIISTHRSITGSWVGNILSVSSGVGGNYSSIVGYINTPNLHDLPFTAWLLDNYMQIYVLLLLIIAMILVVMTLANLRTWQEGVAIFFLMSIILVLPQTFLNNAINISNKFGDKIYSDRFNYWALTQHEQSTQNLLNAATSENAIDYTIASNMERAKNAYSEDAGVRVKWMSPKKGDIFESLFSSETLNEDLASNLSVFKWLFSGFFYQEEYASGDPLASYIYRPYNAIASDAKNSYASLSAKTVDPKTIKTSIDGGLPGVLGASETRFNLLDKDFDKVTMTQEQLDLINQVSASGKDANDYRYWVLGNAEVTQRIFRSNYDNNDEAGLKLNLDTGDDNAKMFLLHTESPFYYFYNVMKTRYTENGGFKSNLLETKTFKVDDPTNSQVNNKVRDFLDLQGLFTHVVPYLAQSNDYVFGWTGVHGKTVDDYNFAKNPDGNGGSITSNEAFLLAENKKKHLEQVWNMYSPWVASLYDTDVLNKKAGIARKSVLVQDTLNPGSYDAVGRPMIFSEADMAAKNYQINDLTDVELKMQQVLNKTYKDMQYLINYRDFDDNTLITAAAMMATFNFNREFSKNTLIGDNVTLYPQGFELKNFNYDAFMRLTLMNATGESLMSKQDLYVRILSKTSFITGVLLLVEDLLAVVIIPTVKMIVILMLLFLGLLMCVSSVVSPPEKALKTIGNTLIFPTFLFMAFSILFSFVVSLFVGEGLTSYVGSRSPSMVTNDPTITIVLLIIVGCIYTYCLVYLIKMLVTSYKSFGIKTYFNTVAMVAQAGSIMNTGVKRGARNATGSVLNAFETQRSRSKTGDSLSMQGYRGGYAPRNNGEFSRGYSGGDSNNTNKSYESPTKDKSLAQDLKDLTSGKNFGQKLIDKKYEIKDTLDKPADAVRSTIGKGQRTVKQISDTVEDITSGEYTKRLREYEIKKQTGRVNGLSRKVEAGEPIWQNKLEKEEDKLSGMEHKLK